MKKLPGFIDPISLITLGIVVVGLVITTFIVKNPEIKLVCLDPCQTNADCNSDEYCYRPTSGCSVCKPKASPTPAPTSAPSTAPSTSPSLPFVRCCPKDNNASAQTTCRGASENACNINASLCEPLRGDNPNAECGDTNPPAPPPPAPNCGGQWEECCGQGYPNGSCNSGLYCSNMDGGTCRTRVCHAERRCEGNVLKICKADDSGWNNTTCQYGCANNDCQAAPPPPPPPPSPACSPNCGCAAATYKDNTCSNGCGGTCPGTKCRTNGTSCGTDASNCCTGFCNTNNVCAAAPTPTIKCSSFGSCYRETYTCQKEFGQLDCRDGYKCGVHCLISSPSPSPKSSTDSPEEGRYTQQLITQIAQTCQRSGGDVCLSRRLCLSEEGEIISSSSSDCRKEQVCCSFPQKINNETVNSKDEKDSLTSTSNAVVPSTTPVFFSDQYHELPPEAYLPTQITPTMIILHWDGQEGSPYGWTTNGTYIGLGFETSAHFAVGIDGVLQMLPMTNTTVARSQGAIGRNDQAINIEMAGWNFDATPPTQKEIDATVNLIIKLMQAYHITINDVFGHSEQDTVNSNGQACVIGFGSDCHDRYKSDPGKEFMDEIRKEVANRLVSQSPAAQAQTQSQTDSTNTTDHYMQTDANLNKDPISEQCLQCNGTDCQEINKQIFMKDVGCGPTAVTNILHNYDIEANPLDLAKRIPANQLFCNGSALSAQVNLLQSYGLQVDGPPPSLYSLDKFSGDGDNLFIAGKVNNIDHFTSIQIKEINDNQTLTLIDSYFSDTPLNCRIVSAQELSCSGKNSEGKSVTVSINYETMFIVNEL